MTCRIIGNVTRFYNDILHDVLGDTDSQSVADVAAKEHYAAMRTTAQGINHVMNSSRGLTLSCNVQACIF
jgi:hypothetical protein